MEQASGELRPGALEVNRMEEVSDKFAFNQQLTDL